MRSGLHAASAERGADGSTNGISIDSRGALAEGSSGGREPRRADVTLRPLLGSAPRILAAVVLAAAVGACAPVVRLSLQPFYRSAQLPPGVEVQTDVPYRQPTGARPVAHPKQRLDLYEPKSGSRAALVFVHGGSFDRGDKDLEIAGLDIYGNLGRFYAARDITVALVDYRLQPEVTWPDQVDDVAAAFAWTVRHLRDRGSAGPVYLAGHSAGAWLASRVALDEEVLARHGVEQAAIAGVIAISGSGFDMTDRTTWEMYPREEWWAERFRRPGAELPWQADASLVPLIDGREPPFLLLHSDSELRALERQNRLFLAALRRSGVDSELIPVSHGSHRRIVLAMSREDREVTKRILAFVADGSKGP